GVSPKRAPPDPLPARENCEGFIRKQTMKHKQGLNHENVQIVHCILAQSGVLCSCIKSATGFRQTNTKPTCTRHVKHEGRAELYALCHHRRCKQRIWRVFDV